jgi:hypothetical protein
VLVGVPASVPAFAFASHDYDESPHGLDHTRGSEHPYTDGNDSTHIANLHNGGRDTFDPYIQQYASINVSSQHSEG